MTVDLSYWTPHLDVASAAAAIVCLGVYVVRGALRGRAGYRRLEAARAAGVPDVLVRFLRRRVLLQSAMAAVVLLGFALSDGISAAEIGLRLPQGPGAAAIWVLTVAFCLAALVGGVLLRRRVRAGLTVPGQDAFAALIPDTARERRWAAVVAVGAGVSEELVFRGLLTVAVGALLAMNPGDAAVPASAIVCVLFGLAHAYQGLRGVLGTSFLAAVLAYLCLGSGSLLPAVVVHVAIDLRALVLVPRQRADAVPHRSRRAAPAPRGPSAAPATDLQDAVGDDRPVLP